MKPIYFNFNKADWTLFVFQIENYIILVQQSILNKLLLYFYESYK